MNRLHKNVMVSHLRQLLLGQLQIFLTGTYKYILLRQEFNETVIGSLQLRTPRPKEIYKLLGIQVPATWPQASAAASCENNTEVSLICFFHL